MKAISTCAPLFALAVALLIPVAAKAWGNDGHRISGYLANELLQDATKKQLRLLLGTDDLAQVATQMDDSRDAFETKHPGASRWHYENRAACGNEIACPQGQCVTRQIDAHLRTLNDSSASTNEKAEAIVVLVHLIADLHQPLHLTDNRDRGGNDVWVTIPNEREPRRLHEAWDTRFVRTNMQRRSASHYARMLANTFAGEFSGWGRGNVDSWAAETYQLGRRTAYSTLPGFHCATRKAAMDGSNALPVALPADYVKTARQIVAEQLAKAGVRIASALNSALGSDSHSDSGH